MGISVLLCDDHPVWRAGLRAVLEQEGDVTVVADVGDGHAAIRMALEVRPDVVVVDNDLPGLAAVEVIRQVAGPHVAAPLPVLLIAARASADVLAALQAGAQGYMPKNVPGSALIEAVRTLAAGGVVLAPEALPQVFHHFAGCTHRPDVAPGNPAVLAGLSPRERGVLRLVARGLTNAGIAAALGLSPATVKSHVSHILRKLGLQDRTQAVVIAYESGFVQPHGSALDETSQAG